MRTPKRNAALAAALLLAVFAATTTVTLIRGHDDRTSAFVPQPIADVAGFAAAAWNGSQAQALFRQWNGHLGDLCANPSHRH